MNETRFRININKMQTIIIIKSYKRFLFTDANNQNYIISIEYINFNINEYILFTFFNNNRSLNIAKVMFLKRVFQ